MDFQEQYRSRSRITPFKYRIKWREKEQEFWDAFQKTQKDEWEKYSVEGFCGVFFDSLQEFQTWRTERWRAKSNLYYLGRNILNYRDFSFIHLDVCDWILKTQDEDIRIILLPRGHFKTTITGIVHSTYRTINDREVRNCIFTGDQKLGIGMIGNPIRKKWLKNQKLHRLFPEVFSPNKSDYDKWKDDEFSLDRDENDPREGVSVSIAAIKTVDTGWHYDFCTADDVVNERNYRNPDMRAETKRIMEFMDAKIDPPKPERIQNRYLFSGTIYHDDDLYWSKVLPDLLTESQLRGLRNNPHHEPLITNNVFYAPVCRTDSAGRKFYIFPERFGDEEMKKKRKKMPSNHIFNSQFFLIPDEPDDKIFKGVYNLPNWTKLPKPLHIEIGVDWADETHKEKGDYTVIRAMGIDPAERRYVLDGERGNWDMEDAYELIFNMCVKWGIDIVNLEKINQVQRYIERNITKYFYDRKREITVNIVPRHGGYGSLDKVEFCKVAMQDAVNGGLYYFPSGDKNVRHELDRFGQGAANDDEVDALANIEVSETFVAPEAGSDWSRDSHFHSPNAQAEYLAYLQEQSSIQYEARYRYQAGMAPVRIHSFRRHN